MFIKFVVITQQSVVIITIFCQLIDENVAIVAFTKISLFEKLFGNFLILNNYNIFRNIHLAKYVNSLYILYSLITQLSVFDEIVSYLLVKYFTSYNFLSLATLLYSYIIY